MNLYCENTIHHPVFLMLAKEKANVIKWIILYFRPFQMKICTTNKSNYDKE